MFYQAKCFLVVSTVVSVCEKAPSCKCFRLGTHYDLGYIPNTPGEQNYTNMQTLVIKQYSRPRFLYILSC